jgi:electron transfer flavoprotein alpha subunit
LANVLVYVELAGDRPCEASLEALGEGRRLASFLGATLYAALPCASPPNYGDDDIIAVLGRHGADKVVLVCEPGLGGSPLYQTHGHALATVCDKIPPAMVIVAATPGGRDIAARLAAHLGAAFVAEPSVEYGPRGELVLSRPVYGGTYRRRLSADDIERPIVTTLTPGSYRRAYGADEAEVVVVESPTPCPAPWKQVSCEADPGAALDRAAIIVTAGAGVEKAAFGLVSSLARAIGAEVGVTRTAVEKGLLSTDHEIGIGGRTVAPRLYIACGASGSPAHLCAVCPDAEIVAINSDPAAPIFRVASYGIVGDVATILPRLLLSLAEPVKEAS